MEMPLPLLVFKQDELTVKVFKNRDHIGKAAMLDAMYELSRLVAIQETIRMVFAAAPSQNEFLEYLETQKEYFDWSLVEAFHMDEYIGLPDKSSQLFASFLNQKIFTRLPFMKIHFIQPDLQFPEKVIDEYAALLQQKPIDIVAMGIGENAHIAFNDPPVADFNDPTLLKIVELDEMCRQQQVNDGSFESVEMVPQTAITLTVPALMSGRKLICIVPGQRKSRAVYNSLTKEISESYPASILRRHKNAVLYLDSDSAELL
jgi:glucosamine-6-phosphate deaminase